MHSNRTTGTITFLQDGQICREKLTREEVETIVSILNGKTTSDKRHPGKAEYACGFHKKVAAIRIGFTTYLLASDGCPVLQNTITGRHFSLTKEELEILRDIFASHG